MRFPTDVKGIFTGFLALPSGIIALGMVALSIFSLASALVAQYGFNLRPCDLCLYQRVPFVLNIFLGVWAYAMPKLHRPLIGIAGLAFLANSVIAFFHSGVERKWWVGITGCTTPDMSGTVEDLLKRITETDVVRCDEIPWSLFGLSMANYNVVFCLGLGMICLIYVFIRRHPAR